MKVCWKCDDCRLYICGLCDGMEKWELLKCAELRKDALKQ